VVVVVGDGGGGGGRGWWWWLEQDLQDYSYICTDIVYGICVIILMMITCETRLLCWIVPL